MWDAEQNEERPEASAEGMQRLTEDQEAEGAEPLGTASQGFADLEAAVTRIGDIVRQESESADTFRGYAAAQLQALQGMHGTISDLVEENRRLRAGESEKILEPVLRDLVSLVDDLQALLENTGHPSLQTAAELISEMLERYGAQQVCPERLDRFDPSQHNGVGRLRVTDPALDGMVAELVAPGYRNRQRFLLYPKVRVYRHQIVD